MDKTYDPHDIEQRIYERWEEHGWFAPRVGAPRYCIVIPPPNVTGTLHMGHAFQHTLMDALTRLHRMEGDNTLWQPGTDHAGIATQMVVERQLNAEGDASPRSRPRGIRRSACGTGRRNPATRSRARSGVSATPSTGRAIASPWTRACRTPSPKSSCACTKKGSSIAASGWSTGIRCCTRRCPTSKSCGAKEQGQLWHFRYPLADGSGHLVVATTRPETMLGDTAVAVHPEDERYRALIGKQIRLPLTDRMIPDHRRRVRRSGVRLRLRQDHAGPRLQRLRDRPAAHRCR